MRKFCQLVLLLVVGVVPAFAQTPATLEVAGSSTRVDINDAMKRLPRHRVTVPANEHGSAGTYDGIYLRDLLSEAKVPAGNAIRGDMLAWTVTLEAGDGYRVVFALAEIDPAFRERVFLLADMRDGKPLDAKQGPLRLIVPDESRPARWIRQVVRIVAGPAGTAK